jgi:hypothetical protein
MLKLLNGWVIELSDWPISARGRCRRVYRNFTDRPRVAEKDAERAGAGFTLYSSCTYLAGTRKPSIEQHPVEGLDHQQRVSARMNDEENKETTNSRRS